MSSQHFARHTSSREPTRLSEDRTPERGHNSRDEPAIRRTSFSGRNPAHRFESTMTGISDHIRGELSSDRIYLVPLRLFIGIGWLRAFAEKAVEPTWRDGTGVATFLQHQLDTGMVVFPSYRMLATNLFLPHATTLAWIILLGQLLAGIAILSGAFTNAALIGGIFMNLNFLLAGATDPSTFYIVIQVLLLLMGVGAIVGTDAWLSRTVRHPLLVAQPAADRWRSPGASEARFAIIIALAVAGYGAAHISDWSPGGSIHDPAVVLVVLASLVAGWATVALMRATSGRPIPADQRIVRHSATSGLPQWREEPARAMNQRQMSLSRVVRDDGGRSRASSVNRPLDPLAQRVRPTPVNWTAD